MMYPELSREEVLRYSRHLMIPDVGMEGQRKLKAARVLIVGTGGLGSPNAIYLAAAGVGRIGIVDYDVVDLSNLQRQVLYSTSRIGQPKIESAVARMRELNPDIRVDAYDEILSSENIEQIAKGYDLLIDGTDNFPTRYLLNDYAVFSKKPYIYGSIFRFEGQVSVFDARSGPCYRCLFPEPPPPGLVPGCAEGGVFGVLPGTIGTLQAAEVIKLILGVGQPLVGKLLLYDALESVFQTIQLRKNPNCKVCGVNPEVTHLIDYEAFCGTPAHSTGEEITRMDVEPAEVVRRLENGEDIFLLDVREPVEQQVVHLPGAVNIPYGQLSSRLTELPSDRDIIAFCRTGSRSAFAVQYLKAEGFDNARNLRGGTNAWARQVDPDLLQY
ncbi:MAG: molybdopterin-synthase adenylyltransferase MoeB [Anaerolineaceae bacterium]|nr:molybdopterin-synthase adenylyltransferase MoeB [Anaerolineaceae bacterium]